VNSIAGRYSTLRRDARRECQLDSSVLVGRLGESPVAAITEPGERAARNELGELLQSAIDLLPPLDQDVLWLLHRDEMTCAEVGALVGLGESGVRMRESRALRKLGAKLRALLAGNLDDALGIDRSGRA
jgi:RNA polymerase sigma factor (sigma-70 family)